VKIDIKPYNLEAGLYLIPTPIGNLMDITLRSLYVLENMDYLACEDTRTTQSLLKQYDIKPPKLFAYYDHNEAEKTDYIIDLIKLGNKVGLVSEAGTPLVSDPGFRIVKSAIENNIKIETLPGATALIPALQLSGFAVHNFTFLGFPPVKKNRKKFLELIVNSSETTIVYESPFKIMKFLEDIQPLIEPDRQVSITREISKLHEETIRGTTTELIAKFKKKKNLKGEFVLVIQGKL
jgi:16S rRNA (cytidine1402-2'-O)-methyltransferase